MTTAKTIHIPITVIIVTTLTGIGLFLSDLYVPSLPAITHALNAGPNLVKLSISSYLLGYALPQLLFGPWSDRVGRKPVVLFGLAVALIGSVICVFATKINVLIIGRFIQGLGGAACLSIARVIIYDLFSGTTLARIGSYMGIVFSLVPTAAPVIGGYVQTLFGWRANFIFMLILVAFAGLLILLLLPETIAEKNLNTLNLKTLSTNYWHILSNRKFWAYTICASIAFAVVMLYATIGPFILQNTLQLIPVQYGWTSLAILIGYIIGKYINTFFIKYLGIKTMVLIGIILILLSGLIMLLFAMFNILNLATITLPIVIALIGCGSITPNAMAGAFSTFKKEIGGAVSALHGFLQIAGAFVVTTSVAHVHENSAIPFGTTLSILGLIALLFFIPLTIERKSS